MLIDKSTYRNCHCLEITAKQNLNAFARVKVGMKFGQILNCLWEWSLLRN
jgi:hypothetical protein